MRANKVIILVVILISVFLQTSLLLAADKDDLIRLFNEGQALSSRFDLKGAIVKWEQALKIARHIGHRQGEGAVLGSLGRAYTDLGDYPKAISYHEQALKIAREIGDRNGEGIWLGNLGLAYMNLSDYAKAINYHEQALKIAREIGDIGNEGIWLGSLGLAYSDLSDYPKAISYYEQALKIAREIGDIGNEGIWLGSLGNTYSVLGDYPKAIGYFEQALKIIREIGDRKGEGAGLGNLGNVYSKLGDYPKAISYHEQALKIAKEIGDKINEGRWLGNLGLAYMNLGDYAKAISHYEKALKIAREIGDRNGEGIWLGNLGLAYMNLSDYAKAISHYEEALKIAREIEDRLGEWHHLGKLGIAHLLRGDIAKAEEILKDYIPLIRGTLHIYQNQPHKAIATIKESLAQVEEVGRSEALFGQYTTLALAYEMKGNISDARHYFKKVVERIEEERERLNEGQKTHFFAAMPYFNWNRLTPYEGLIRISPNDEAFYYSESIKARLLLEQMAGKYKGADFRVSKDMRERELQVTDNLAALLKQQENAYKRNDKERIAYLNEEIRNLRKERDKVIAELYRTYPEYAAIRYPKPLTLQDIKLYPHEVLIEYAVTDTETVAWLIKGKKILKTLRVKVSRKDLDKLIEDYRHQIANLESLYEQKAFNPKVGYRLYQLLIKDLLPLIDKKDRLIIVPDKKLAILPFETLITFISPDFKIKEGKWGYYPEGIKYLGDDYKISYYQSASALTLERTLKKKETTKKALFVLADPVFTMADNRIRGEVKLAQADKPRTTLMRTVEEVSGLRFDRLEMTGRLADILEETFKGEGVDTLIGLDASYAKLGKKDLSQYRYLVFATHGILDNHISGIREPALVLSQVDNPKERDGFLTLSEVMSLNLGSDVSALTACETGMGRQLSGEGVMGMGRAFQYAGSKSVLVSLWSVAEESTIKLAEQFFFYQKQGKDRLTSLRLARDDVRKAGYKHPFFWAPFILIGE